MAMQIKKGFKISFLFTLLVLAAQSCITTDKTVGEKYVPEDQYLKIALDSFALPLKIKSADSVQTASTAYMAIGSIRTEEFGLAKFGSAANICPSSTALDFGEDPQIVSIYMLAPLAEVSSYSTMERTSIYFDQSQSNIVQNFHVYRLNRYIDSSMLFHNSIKESDYSPVPLNMNEVVYAGGDSIKIYLDNSLGAELLTATDEELDTISRFVKRFGGLYITSDEPIGSDIGGRLNLFSRSATVIYMKYNFKPTWDENLERKDTLVSFVFGDSYCINTISLSSKGKESNNTSLKELPVEGSAGVNPYIDAQELKSIIDNWIAEMGYDPSKIVVGKATLTFPFEFPEDFSEIDNKYPPYLFPVQRRNINDTTFIKYYYPFSDNSSTDNPLGEINRSTGNYICDFTSTVQQLIANDASEIDDTYNIWLYPIVQETDATYGTKSIVIDQVSYFNGKINGPGAERYPMMTILYTVLND